jgi:CHAT domain-containing protein
MQVAIPVLAIGDPDFDRRRFPGLTALPEARREAERIGASHPESIVLTGASATRERFLELAPRAGVIYIASHAVLDAQRPELSMLALAPAAPGYGSGALYAYEIAALDLSGVKLVVLAGCHSAGGPRSRTEGLVSLARAFLAAGVPSVVGAQRQIPDSGVDDWTQHMISTLSRGLYPLEGAGIQVLRSGTTPR